MHTFHTAILTATEWENFYALRIDPAAQPEFNKIASMMREASLLSVPREVGYDGWHLPFIKDEDVFEVKKRYPRKPLMTVLANISAGRCARVSYLTHDGQRDVDVDLDMGEKLQNQGHMSPFEHVARPATSEELAMNAFNKFKGWTRLRELLPNEGNFGIIKSGIK